MPILDCLSGINPSPFLAVNAVTGIPGVSNVAEPVSAANSLDNQLNVIMGSAPIGIIIFFSVLFGLGVAIALISFSLKPQQESSVVAVGGWNIRYTDLVRLLQHLAIVSSILIIGTLICSSVASSYHLWEQDKFPRAAATAQQIEQMSPQILYTVKEPAKVETKEGEPPKIITPETETPRLLPVSSSSIQVAINKSRVRGLEKWIYTTDFAGEYEVRNITPNSVEFLLKMAPPKGAYIVQSYVIEQDGRRISANSAGEYEYLIQIANNGTTKIKTTYQAQGAPRWLYVNRGELLNRFQLSIATNFNNVTSASGLIPSYIEKRPKGKTFTWTIPDNATIPYPIGASTPNILPSQVGAIPRVILFAPGVWVWWLVLLYFSVPLRLRDVLITAGVAAAGVSTLAYGMRLFKTELTGVAATPELVWPVVAIFILLGAWGLGKDRRTKFAVIVCTITGLILPVFGLLSIYQGVFLSLAVILSAFWLVAINWYGWFQFAVDPEEDIELFASSYLEDKYDEEAEIASLLKLDPATGDYIEHMRSESTEKPEGIIS
jgi:hypothetical protein